MNQHQPPRRLTRLPGSTSGGNSRIPSTRGGGGGGRQTGNSNGGRGSTEQRQRSQQQHHQQHTSNLSPSPPPSMNTAAGSEVELMGPPPPPAPRINYAEELEKTEQSITLALQEIDRNFAKAHKIVATSVVPVIEQYGQESRRVWQGAAFWKQFLEASANVSLSGYEEIAAPMDDEQADMTTDQQQQQEMYGNHQQYHDEAHYGQKTMMPLQYGDESTLQQGDVKQEDQEEGRQGYGEEELDNDHDMTKTPKSKIIHQQGSGVTPVVKRERGGHGGDHSMIDDDTSLGLPDPPSATTRIFMNPPGVDGGAGHMLPPRTPVQRQQDIFDFNSVASSPFNSKLDIIPADYHNSPSMQKETPGVLRHRVLDKNWRIQMTPHGTGVGGSSTTPRIKREGAINGQTTTSIATPHRTRGNRDVAPGTDSYYQSLASGGAGNANNKGKQSFAARFDSSPLDGLEPPELHADIQFSPTPSNLKYMRGNAGSNSSRTNASNKNDTQNPFNSNQTHNNNNSNNNHFMTPKKQTISSSSTQITSSTPGRGWAGGPPAGGAAAIPEGIMPKTPIQRFYSYNNELSDSSFSTANHDDDDDEMDTTMKTPNNHHQHQFHNNNNNSFFDDDEDTSMNGFGLPDGMSPPVTMNFTIPASALQRTPAREAAQSMVQDILRGAGADDMELD